MSLWHEGLMIDLYDCGDDNVQRAKCILSYLSMSIPRMWWENSLMYGKVDPAYASLLLKLKAKLSEIENINSAMLIALSFMDKETKSNCITVKDYFDEAAAVLREKPELEYLGKLIDENGGLKEA